MSTNLIQRKEYINKLDAWRDKQVIKVVTGVRRCGKSSLFTLFIERLKESGIGEKNIIAVNLEDIVNKELLTADSLYKYISDRLCENEKTYVFIDEVQQCHEFEKAVDSLYIKENVDLYITGSNAKLLSGDLATLLSGRYVEIDMLPLSFSEYLEFAIKGHPNLKTQKISFPIMFSEAAGLLSINTVFNSYIRFGCLPYVPMLDADMLIVDKYLDGVYNTIIVKDIVSRSQIREITVLEDVVKCLCSSIGSYVSIKKISDTLNSAGRKISVNTVEQYVRALTDSFVFYKVDRFDVKGKQHLKTQNKYYIVDTGIRNLLLAQASADIGHMLENIVYFELIRRGNKVNIGKVGDKEVDFVAANTKEGTSYYQVATTVLDENTLERELASLNKIEDHSPKYLLTLDEIGSNSIHNGIRQLNVIEWLLKQQV